MGRATYFYKVSSPRPSAFHSLPGRPGDPCQDRRPTIASLSRAKRGLPSKITNADAKLWSALSLRLQFEDQVGRGSGHNLHMTAWGHEAGSAPPSGVAFSSRPSKHLSRVRARRRGDLGAAEHAGDLVDALVLA